MSESGRGRNHAPAMICRPPTIGGSLESVQNAAEVARMNGVTHVKLVPSGVAVRAHTFGQCIDAIRALKMKWKPGTAEGTSDESIREELKAAELPLTTPELPALAETMDFVFRSGSPLEPKPAVADVRADSARIWASAKARIAAKQEIAAALALPSGKGRCEDQPGPPRRARHRRFLAGRDP